MSTVVSDVQWVFVSVQLYLLIVQLPSQNFRGHPVGGAHDGQRLLPYSITAKKARHSLSH
ncbi:hypothetical protein EYF80_056677 [Liparis tanakae]|uniref:Uncharacterized protein n=1 Tax=Liparis tanakae TaxID=230148 RepID=A0A4Z2EWB0_9TELE|nr:hypothetical protein EYF80_056677 [Liparis tanakae]